MSDGGGGRRTDQDKRKKEKNISSLLPLQSSHLGEQVTGLELAEVGVALDARRGWRGCIFKFKILKKKGDKKRKRSR